jgi:O-antigen/teichoic acid export membrane protein
MLFIPAIIFMMVFGDSIATILFGANFAPAGNLVSILSLYIYLNAMLGILTQVLYSTNNNHLYRNSTIVYSISTLILLMILVPENIGDVNLAGLGAEGAALAITGGYLIFIALTNYYVKVSAELSMHKGLIRQFLAGAIVFAVVFLIRGDNVFGLLPLILILLLCFSLFGALLFALREMNKDDLLFILHALNPKAMRERSNGGED